MSDTVAIAPLPHYYAVIRIDAVAMVKDLELDEHALAEATVLDARAKKYLVYMVFPAELPLPASRWCRYDIKPIGTTLRPPDETRGITANMVVPVAVNTHYSGQRRPVYPFPSFPFYNCYHWIKNDMQVRVRVTKGGVDHAHGVRLSVEEDHLLNKAFRDNYKHIRAFIRSARVSSTQEIVPTPAPSAMKAVSTSATLLCQQDNDAMSAGDAVLSHSTAIIATTRSASPSEPDKHPVSTAHSDDLFAPHAVLSHSTPATAALRFSSLTTPSEPLADKDGTSATQALQDVFETYCRIAEEHDITTSSALKSNHATRSESRPSPHATSRPTSPFSSELTHSAVTSTGLPSIVDVVATTDIFGWNPDPMTALLPLVDAWLDIEQHFVSDDDIPSPMELLGEVEVVRSIIIRAVARKTFLNKGNQA